MKQTFLIFLSALLLSGCHGTRQFSKDLNNPSPYFISLMDGYDNTVFHGINFNMQQEEVRKMETAKLYERTKDHLFYNLVFPKDSTAFNESADIQYFFDKTGGIEIMTATVYVNDSLEQNRLLQTFQQYFSNRYGDATKDDYKYQVWKGTMEAKDDDYDYSIGLNTLNKDDEEEYGVVLEYLKD